MQEDLSNYRKSYEKNELIEINLPEDPIQLFHKWFHEVKDFGRIDEINAMSVSTIGLDGFPKTRVVLLKKYYEEGFIFYTNYNSEKGQSIEKYPNICLSFFWSGAERQVIIKGTAEKCSEAVSDNYFASRPKGSQLGSIVSNQSEIIPSKAVLEKQLKQLEKQFEGQEVLRPKHWGGFLVRPVEVEFWQGRPNRLHDRIRYLLKKDISWKIDRLAP